MENSISIEISNVSHRYADRLALDGVDLTIHSGEIFGLLGPNGGGKTTLFQILCTLLQPTEGTVKVLGRDVVHESSQVRLNLGVVFQKPSLDHMLTVKENLRHQGHLYALLGSDLTVRIDRALERVGLVDRGDDRVAVLSGGLQRRVELAKALLHDPTVLIFDEPSTGLDPGARRNLWDDLEALRQQEGITVVLTTHFMEEAERCDRVGILGQGRMIALGTPRDLKQTVGQDVITIETSDPDRLRRNIESTFDVDPKVLDGVLRIESTEGQYLMAKVYNKFRIEIDSITLGKPTLEDVFIQHTGTRFQTEKNSTDS